MHTPDTITQLIGTLLPEPQASLLAGMLLGVKGTMPREFFTALQKTGTLHMIALSGTNISIIISLIGSLLGGFGRRIASLLTVVFIVLFVFFVGPSASVVRASLMGSITLIGISAGRQRDGVLVLLFTALLMLAASPSWIIDIGFQLSFMATLGILLYGQNSLMIPGFLIHATGPAIRQPHRHPQGDPGDGAPRLMSPVAAIGKTLLLDLRVTLAAQIFTLPVILWHFHELSLIAPLTNLLVGWVVAPITIIGLVMAVASIMFYPLAWLLSFVLWPMLTYFIWIVEWTASVPWASVQF